MGDSEDFASDYEPSRVAEAGKTAYFIGINDVLTKDEKILLNLETQAYSKYLVLKNDSDATDVTSNFLAELASTGKCLDVMEALDLCLRSRAESASGERSF